MGVLDENKNLLTGLSTQEVDRLIETGVIYGGMIPKVGCALDAVKGDWPVRVSGKRRLAPFHKALPHATLLLRGRCRKNHAVSEGIVHVLSCYHGSKLFFFCQ